MRKSISLLLIGLIAVTALGWYVWPRPVLIRMRNIRNWADLGVVISLIEDFQSKNGRFPDTIQEVALFFPADAKQWSQLANGLDSYGFPLGYERQGQRYLLISYGSDGKPQYTDYWSLRGKRESFAAEQSECRRAGVDIICFETGCYRSCGK